MKKLILLLSLFILPIAHAGLFEDDEARRAILDLRKKLDSQSEEIKKNAEDIKKFQSNLIEQQNLFENLRNEIQRVRGEKEELTQELRKQQAAAQAQSQVIDERLKKFEPIKVKLENTEFLAEPTEIRFYEAALAAFRKGEFSNASEGFIDFNKRYPNSGFGSISLFWLGNAQYANREYKEAIKNFNNLLTKEPEHSRAPDAMLSVANCQLEMKDVKSARKTLEELMKKYPQ
ncbi:MAG: tol-pal system protein YbgF, partial [Flavobacteriia bacterium]|nr:tol-pal system protein YbgF [Flavobacteriia bacterium]